jgi:hypothetical protein
MHLEAKFTFEDLPGRILRLQVEVSDSDATKCMTSDESFCIWYEDGGCNLFHQDLTENDGEVARCQTCLAAFKPSDRIDLVLRTQL